MAGANCVFCSGSHCRLGSSAGVRARKTDHACMEDGLLKKGGYADMLASKSTAAATEVSGAALFARESVAHPLAQALATVRSVRLDVLLAIANRSDCDNRGRC